MMNEGFGKKWIEKILGKVDKDQGVANAGKVLGIGNDGQVTPVEQSGGGSSAYVEKISSLSVDETFSNSKIKSGDRVVITNAYIDVSPLLKAGTVAVSTTNNFKTITGSPTINYGSTNKPFELIITEPYNDTFYYFLNSYISPTVNYMSGNLTVGEDTIPYNITTITRLGDAYPAFSRISIETMFTVTLGTSSPYIPVTYTFTRVSNITSCTGFIYHNS